MTSIVIGSDLYPGGRCEELLAAGEAERVFGFTLELFREADLSVVNLECPLVDVPSPIRKSGPNLRAGTAVARGLAAAGIDVAGLANNHIMDHGAPGLEATWSALDAAGIQWIGSGADVAQARTPGQYAVNGLEVRVLAVAEAEFCQAGPAGPGANPFDLPEVVRSLRQVRDGADFVVVLVHGGIEMLRYPTPRLREHCRFLVEEGADLVVVQHTHCDGCMEEWGDGRIVYGQGNLLFDDFPRRVGGPWCEGFLVRVHLTGPGDWSMELVPYSHSGLEPGIREADQQQAARMTAAFRKRSAVVAEDAAFLAEWETFCEGRLAHCFDVLRGYGKVRRWLNRRFGLGPRMYLARRPEALLNLVKCESHRDALITALERWVRDE